SSSYFVGARLASREKRAFMAGCSSSASKSPSYVAIGIASTAPSSRAVCVPWASGTSPSHQPRLGRMASLKRVLGSVRREWLDHFVVWGEIHLRRILRHNDIRTHWSLDKDAQAFHPNQRTGIIAILSSPLRPDLGFRCTQVTALLTGTAYRSTPPTKMLLPCTRLNHNRTGHVRMQGTKIRIGAQCSECKREFVVGVERF